MEQKRPLFSCIDCIRLYVPDLEEGIKYYCGSLGLKIIWKSDSEVGLGMAEGITEVVIQNESRKQEIDIKVDSVIEALDKIKKAGGHVIDGPFDIRIGKCAVVKDPWDNEYIILDATKGTLITDNEGNIIEHNKPEKFCNNIQMKNVEKQERVFEKMMNEEELIKFSMFYEIWASKDPFIVTDDKSVIIGQKRTTSPLFVYIKDNLSESEQEEVAKIICKRLELNPSLTIDGEEKYTKKVLEKVSNISGFSFEISLLRNAYACHEIIKPEIICGSLSRANEDDLDTIAVFSRDNWEDIGFGTLTHEQAYKFAHKKLANPDFYVWRNEDKKIVSMATAHKYGDAAITDGVFTDKNERKKGYAKFLMYEITKNLLNEGIKPMLYADCRKEAPNRLYKDIGYKYYGQVTEYTFLKHK